MIFCRSRGCYGGVGGVIKCYGGLVGVKKK